MDYEEAYHAANHWMLNKSDHVLQRFIKKLSGHGWGTVRDRIADALMVGANGNDLTKNPFNHGPSFEENPLIGLPKELYSKITERANGEGITTQEWAAKALGHHIVLLEVKEVDTRWDCSSPESDKCAYEDGDEHCVHCGQPEERK